MTKEQAENLKTFENYCTCGGFAWNINGRSQEQPHMTWCPQYKEYEKWFKELNGKTPSVELKKNEFVRSLDGYSDAIVIEPYIEIKVYTTMNLWNSAGGVLYKYPDSATLFAVTTEEFYRSFKRKI